MKDLKIQHKVHKVWAPNIGKFIDETYTHGSYDGMVASIPGAFNPGQFKAIIEQKRKGYLST